jgi:hypothetical protein
VPDLDWLAARLAPGPDHDRAVVLSHVAPWSGDFDPALRDRFLALLSEARVPFSFHAHDHHFKLVDHGGVRYVIADDATGRVFYLVTVGPDGALSMEQVPF